MGRAGLALVTVAVIPVLSAGAAVAAVKFGTDSLDELFGTGGSDMLYGRSGSDFVEGCGGNDILYGEELLGLEPRAETDDGEDVMHGGDGNDDIVSFDVRSRLALFSAAARTGSSPTSGTGSRTITRRFSDGEVRRTEPHARKRAS